MTRLTIFLKTDKMNTVTINPGCVVVLPIIIDMLIKKDKVFLPG